MQIGIAKELSYMWFNYGQTGVVMFPWQSIDDNAPRQMSGCSYWWKGGIACKGGGSGPEWEIILPNLVFGAESSLNILIPASIPRLFRRNTSPSPGETSIGGSRLPGAINLCEEVGGRRATGEGSWLLLPEGDGFFLGKSIPQIKSGYMLLSGTGWPPTV
jgi:hypothetical protein